MKTKTRYLKKKKKKSMEHKEGNTKSKVPVSKQNKKPKQ